MAPSCEVGHSQRSLVRIPGSGTDRSMKPVCLEIDQIASFQMADIIPKFQLPPEIRVLNAPTFNIFEQRRNTAPHLIQNENTSSLATGIANSNNSEAISLKRSLEDEDSEFANKRTNDVESEFANKRTNDVESEDEDKNCVEPTMRKIRILLEDRYELKKENEYLKLKLDKFKELLKDRSKLNEFLSAMKELEC